MRESAQSRDSEPYHETVTPEQIEGIETPDIRLATVELLEELVVPDARGELILPFRPGRHFDDAYHPFGQGVVVAGEGNPGVIYDDGAAFCSPTIIFNDHGDAVHGHPSLVSDSMQGFERDFLDHAKEVFSPDEPLYCVLSGTNVDVAEAYRKEGVRNPVDQSIASAEAAVLGAFPQATFEALVSHQYQNQERYDKRIPAAAKIRGYVFIPRDLAVDYRNHVLPVLAEEARRIREYYHF